MARFSRSQDDTTDIRVFIKDYLDFVISVQHFELAEPLKLHALALHVLELSEKYHKAPSICTA